MNLIASAIAAGMMLSASFSLMEEGVSLEADGCVMGSEEGGRTRVAIMAMEEEGG